MDQEIRYADSGVVPEGGGPAVRDWRPWRAARRMEISHEWPRGAVSGRTAERRSDDRGSAAADPFAGYENYAGNRSW
jgi:hypothetical protein